MIAPSDGIIGSLFPPMSESQDDLILNVERLTAQVGMDITLIGSSFCQHFPIRFHAILLGETLDL
jgi:hypothetical protein